LGEGLPAGVTGDNDDQVLLGYLLARHYSKLRGARGGTPKPAPPRPTMPKRRWRLLALTCLVSGVVMGVAAAGSLGSSLVRGGVVGGLVLLVGGMLLIETIWERRRR
jgi:hypothetical protein